MSRTDWRFPRRKERKAEAKERQEYCNSLNIEQRITVAEDRRGDSKKELIKLRKLL